MYFIYIIQRGFIPYWAYSNLHLVPDRDPAGSENLFVDLFGFLKEKGQGIGDPESDGGNHGIFIA